VLWKNSIKASSKKTASNFTVYGQLATEGLHFLQFEEIHKQSVQQNTEQRVTNATLFARLNLHLKTRIETAIQRYIHFNISIINRNFSSYKSRAFTIVHDIKNSVYAYDEGPQMGV
jgi:hypothetical protein